MKLLFNLKVCQPVGNIKRHGGGIYGEIVLKRIIERNLPVVCYYDAQKWLNPELVDIIHKKGIELLDSNNYTLEDIVSKCKIDVLYSPLYIGLNDFHTCKLICTIHGLRGVETPSDFFFFKYKSSLKEKIKFLLSWQFPSYFRRKSTKELSRINQDYNFTFVTVSNHSLYGFKSYYPNLFKDKEVQVFYSPSTISNLNISNNAYHEKFFLLVSAGIWVKNNLRAIMAFDRLFSSGYLQDYKVRITGISDGKVFKYKIKNPEHFLFMGYVDDDILHQLFHDAFCLVYPSLNEGFGYPPVESMSFGIPVIASSFTSIFEICQDAAMYFNPYSVEEIMNRILQMTNGHIHEEYVEKAKKRYIEVHKKQEEDLNGLIDYIYSRWL